jgi:uncharacterized protein YegL
MSDALDDFRGGTSRRSLKLAFLIDVSGSMHGDKIQAVNRAVHECIPELRRNNAENPFAEMTVEVITFSTGAVWHVPRTPVDQFGWRDVGAGGVTDLGAAVDLLHESLDVQNMGRRNLPPVIVLLSDGGPTDNWLPALKKFNATPWGKSGRTVRIAIAIGEGADKQVLTEFTGNPETVLSADRASTLVNLIKWASVTVSKAHSTSVAITAGDAPPAAAPLPPPPVSAAFGADDDDEPW